MNAQEMSRVYGYVRASTDKQIASPETQRQIIEEYAKRLGRSVDRFFIDPAVSGKKSLFDRDDGKGMITQLKTGDEIIVARLGP
jgi:DNA invertase Pin-like site-specific DNA recombinase